MSKAELEILVTVRTARKVPLIPAGPTVVSDRTWRTRRFPAVRREVDRRVVTFGAGVAVDTIMDLVQQSFDQLLFEPADDATVRAIAEDLEKIFSEAEEKADAEDEDTPALPRRRT